MQRRRLPTPSMVVIGLPADGAETRDARARGLAVDEHRAGAAVPLAAAELAAGQFEIVAEHREQAVARVALDAVGLAVDAQDELATKILTPAGSEVSGFRGAEVHPGTSAKALV